MSTLRQLATVSQLGLIGLRKKPGLSIVIVFSVASVVGVLLSMLSLSLGFMRVYTSGTDPRLAIVVSADASQGEGGSNLSRDTVNTVLNAPGIARGAAGELLASTELVSWITPDEDSAAVGFVVRGASPTGPAMRPGFHIVAGRPFRPGARELIVGIGAQRVFGMTVGGHVVMPDGEWPIVGVFSAGGNILESDLMADADTLLSTMRRTSFNSVLVRLQSAAALEPFRQWLAANPGLTVTADRQADYSVRTETGYNRNFFNAIAALVGLTMAAGALFGTVKVLYALVRARSREIAMLRAIGYDAVPVAAAVIAQSVVLCAVGAALGAAVAWFAFDGKLTWYYNNIFTLSIPPSVVALAVGGAVTLAALAGVPPAVRAAGLPVAESLREAS